MSRFHSRIATHSADFAANRADMLALIERYRQLLTRAPAASEARAERFQARGQLTPRQRLAQLIDPGTPFQTIGNLAGYMMDSRDEAKSIPGSTVITGIGFIAGVRAMIVVDDSGIKAGSLTTAGGWRIRRAQDIAMAQKLPFVHLVESAGGDLLNYTVEGFVDGGRLFSSLAKLSAAGVPTIAVLHGSSTAGGAYMPGLSDYVIAVKGRGKAFLAGPPLLKAATGEIATEEELGGADMHASISGLADYLAADDADAMLITRELVSRLGWGKGGADQAAHQQKQSIQGQPPAYDPDELCGVVPVDYRQPYDVRELLARVVDGSDLLDFKDRYGPATICTQARICGTDVGIIANNGPIDPDGATKAGQFIQLMDQAAIPLIFLQNTTGYMVGTAAERAGMIKHGSKMIQAVTNVRVPKITLNVGASFGAGNYGMCGRAYDPAFMYSWPNARTGVMGGDQAAKTMSIVATAKAAAAGQELPADMLAAQEKAIADNFDRQSDAFYTSGHLLDDGMIDPRDSRSTLAFLLDTIKEASNRSLQPNSFGVARL